MTRLTRVWSASLPERSFCSHFPLLMRKEPSAALVLADTEDEDVVVCRITSQRGRDSFDIELAGWREAGLLLPAVVRVHKLATLEKRLVERKLGALVEADWRRVHAALQALWPSR